MVQLCSVAAAASLWNQFESLHSNQFESSYKANLMVWYCLPKQVYSLVDCCRSNTVMDFNVQVGQDSLKPLYIYLE